MEGRDVPGDVQTQAGALAGQGELVTQVLPGQAGQLPLAGEGTAVRSGSPGMSRLSSVER